MIRPKQFQLNCRMMNDWRELGGPKFKPLMSFGTASPVPVGPLVRTSRRVEEGASGPIRPVQRAVLNRFSEVLWLNRFGGVQIGNRPGDFQDAVMCPRRKPQLGHRVFQKLLAFGGNRAMFANQLWRHLRVRVGMLLTNEPLLLALSSFHHPRPHRP